VPLYEYQCRKCQHRYEKIQKFSDKPEAPCPECGGDGKRLLSAPAVHFKGSGWYVTDYARKEKRGGEDKDKPAPSSTANKSSSEKKPSGSGKKD
jgi:putative FmdB family regulatory protein